jgi:hypothetical protein
MGGGATKESAGMVTKPAKIPPSAIANLDRIMMLSSRVFREGSVEPIAINPNGRDRCPYKLVQMRKLPPIQRPETRLIFLPASKEFFIISSRHLPVQTFKAVTTTTTTGSCHQQIAYRYFRVAY